MPILFIPVGIPGCGKSYLAEAVGADAIVSTDRIREGKGDVNDQSRNQEVFAQFHCDIHTLLAGNRSVYADATNLDARSRLELRDIANQITRASMDIDLTTSHFFQPVVTHLILFRNPLEALNRNRLRSRKVPEDVMLRMLEKYERAVQDIENEKYDYVTEVSKTR